MNKNGIKISDIIYYYYYNSLLSINDVSFDRWKSIGKGNLVCRGVEVWGWVLK